MGCFPKCIPSCIRRKHKKSVTFTPFEHQSLEAAEEVSQIPPAEPTKLEDSVNAIKPTKESEEENGEESKSGGKKEATFDLNVSSTKEVINGLVEICDENENDKEIKTILGSTVSAAAVASQLLNHRYENCENSEDDDGEFESTKQMLIQEESSESLFSLSIDSRKQEVCDAETDEKEVNSAMPKQAIGSNPKNLRGGGENCHSVLTPVENLAQWEEVREKATPRASKQQQEKENINVEQHCQLPFCPDPILKLSKRPKSNDDDGVRVDTSFSSWLVELTPVENLAQWEVVREKATPRASKQQQEKENINVEQHCQLPFCPDPILKLSKRPKSNDDDGVRVDTSFSSWLVESETTPMSNTSDDSVSNNNSNSPRSHEDKPRSRPILGAWTSEELRQLSVSSTLKQPRSPADEMPVIGTVGSYWSRTGQAVYSDSSSCSSTGLPKTAKLLVQDQKVKWKPAAFEAKLERDGV